MKQDHLLKNEDIFQSMGQREKKRVEKREQLTDEQINQAGHVNEFQSESRVPAFSTSRL